MQDILLKFGICLLVVIDDGTLFKATFTAACDSLKIPFECSAKRNHTLILVEKFYRSLNKVVTIESNDRDTLDYFVEAGISAGYAWISAPMMEHTSFVVFPRSVESCVSPWISV